MNIANKITIVRVLMSFIIIIILLFPFYQVGVVFPKYIVNDQIMIDMRYIIAGVLFLIGAITDFIDGFIARHYGLVTDFGKLMDAIADKILVNSVLIILAVAGFISPIIPVIIVMRDSIVNSVKMLAATKGEVVAASNLGKLKTIAMMTGITLTFFYNLPFAFWNLQVADFCLITATVLALISGLQYVVINGATIIKEEGK